MAVSSPLQLATQMVFSPAVNSRASPLGGRSDLEAIFTKLGMRPCNLLYSFGGQKCRHRRPTAQLSSARKPRIIMTFGGVWLLLNRRVRGNDGASASSLSVLLRCC